MSKNLYSVLCVATGVCSNHYADSELQAVEIFAKKHYGKNAEFHKNSGITANGLIYGQITKKTRAVISESRFDVELK